MAVVPGERGREAVTHWRVVETFGRGERADRLAASNARSRRAAPIRCACTWPTLVTR